MPDVDKAPSPLIRKLDELAGRFDALRESMNDPAVLANQMRIVALAKESGQLEPVVMRYREYEKAAAEVESLHEMARAGGDAEMAALATAELPEAETKADGLLEALKDELLAAVWPGLFVTENSLVQCISDIRTALGNDGGAVLKTVARRGYRAMQRGRSRTVVGFRNKVLVAGLRLVPRDTATQAAARANQRAA